MRRALLSVSALAITACASGGARREVVVDFLSVRGTEGNTTPALVSVEDNDTDRIRVGVLEGSALQLSGQWRTSVWLAGGGVKAGHVHGETCEHGDNVALDPVHVHDLNATLLHLFGFDHERLVYRHQGRRYRLTDVHGTVVQGLLA